MDDGSVKVFRGYRVQHNDARSPQGLYPFSSMRRLIPSELFHVDDMEMFCHRHSSGAVKAGDCDHAVPSENKRLCRGYIRQLVRNVGPNTDVPAPDVMTSSKHMLWMLDEYETILGGRYPGFITGKPVGMGGSLGRTEATGFGVIYVLREALKSLNIDIKNTSASFQGFGNVSQYAVRLYQQLGGKVVAISCWEADKTSYTFQEGYGYQCLSDITDAYGTIDKDKARTWL